MNFVTFYPGGIYVIRRAEMTTYRMEKNSLRGSNQRSSVSGTGNSYSLGTTTRVPWLCKGSSLVRSRANSSYKKQAFLPDVFQRFFRGLSAENAETTNLR